MDCHRAVGADVIQDVNMNYPVFLKRDRYCLILHCVALFLVVDEGDAKRDSVLSTLLLQIVYDIDVICH